MNKISNDHWLVSTPIAHRGIQMPGIPENTLESCVLAAEKGYPIEFDLKLTNKGEIILLHDQTLKRVAGIKKFYANITQEDLENIKYLNRNVELQLFQNY